MDKVKHYLFGALSIALIGTAAAEDGALTIQASGFKHGNGQAVAKLFQPGDDVLGRGRQQVSAAISNGQAVLEFAGLPTGRYAVVVFHDENGNGVIDHNVLRLPSEPLGFSNGFILGLVSGLPSFDKLAFQHASVPQTLEIVVK